jgi:hypothetical protein
MIIGKWVILVGYTQEEPQLRYMDRDYFLGLNVRFPPAQTQWEVRRYSAERNHVELNNFDFLKSHLRYGNVEQNFATPGNQEIMWLRSCKGNFTQNWNPQVLVAKWFHSWYWVSVHMVRIPDSVLSKHKSCC